MLRINQTERFNSLSSGLTRVDADCLHLELHQDTHSPHLRMIAQKEAVFQMGYRCSLGANDKRVSRRGESKLRWPQLRACCFVLRCLGVKASLFSASVLKPSKLSSSHLSSWPFYPKPPEPTGNENTHFSTLESTHTSAHNLVQLHRLGSCLARTERPAVDKVLAGSMPSVKNMAPDERSGSNISRFANGNYNTIQK